MMISIFNKKGGVGKTSFAFSLAKDLGFYLQSNDASLIETTPPEMSKISERPTKLENCVYDFGGFVDAGVYEILEASSYIIVPCDASYNSIYKTIETLTELKELKEKIIVIATNFCDDDEKKEIVNNLKEYYEGDIFFFKRSKIVNNSIKNAESFNEISKNKFFAYPYKNFLNEYKKLLKYLK